MFQLAKAIYFEMVEYILFLHKVELRYEYVLKGKVANFEIKLIKNLSPGQYSKEFKCSNLRTLMIWTFVVQMVLG